MGFKGNEYSLLLLLFYIPNAIFDLPLNLLTKRFSGRIVLSSLCVGWGAMSVLQVACKNFAGMLVVRLILGHAYIPMDYRRIKLMRNAELAKLASLPVLSSC